MEGINLLSLWEFKVPNFWKSECFFFISIFIIIIIIIIIIVIIIIIIITSNIGKSNYCNYFILYKASNLNLEIIWSKRLALPSFFSAAYLFDKVTVHGCPL